MYVFHLGRREMQGLELYVSKALAKPDGLVELDTEIKMGGGTYWMRELI